MTTKNPLTREQWLQHAVSMIRTDMESLGVTIPPVKVSCSWPGGGSAQKRIGECWPRAASQAGINEIFISPKIEAGERVVGILAHELAHAVDDCAHGHGAAFAAIGAQMGMIGKPTQVAPHEAVCEAWNAVMEAAHGAYPHAVLDKSMSPVKKQGTRMLKCECGCGAVWRLTQKVIDMVEGAMSCPACHGDESITINGQSASEDDADD
jgi:SprT-like family